jgi:hypothetical protein
MLETYAWNLVNCTYGITSLRETLQTRIYATRGIGFGPAEITENDRNSFEILLGNTRKWLGAHDLTASLDQLERIAAEVQEQEPNIDELVTALKFFGTTLEDELRRRTFLYVIPEDAALYRSPLASFGLTQAAYPSARNDIHEACRCYALSRYTLHGNCANRTSYAS